MKAKQHAQRVAAALGRKHGLIYLLGQYAYDKEDSDMPKTWYQRRFFYYMSGVDEPNACLTYDCETHQLILYIEEIDWDRVIWTGRGSTIEEAKERYITKICLLCSHILIYRPDMMSMTFDGTLSSFPTSVNGCSIEIKMR